MNKTHFLRHRLKQTIIHTIWVTMVFLSHGKIHSQGIHTVDDIDQMIGKAEAQYREMVKSIPDTAKYPRTSNEDGTLKTVEAWDWTSGFFPGSLWLLYEYSGDPFWLDQAVRRTAGIEGQKFNTGTHDLGFMLGCSFGNGYRLTENAAYADILVTAAGSLSSRFNSNVGCIRSWDFGSWQFPVIIDNMMNLELLFQATRLTGDSSYWEKAVSHADVTLENHFREDFSSYHVVDYNQTTGDTIGKYTHQGFSRESAWARGQAWGLYGYTMCYRFTKDPRYLDTAEKIALFMLGNDNFPEDGVPYWDFDAPGIPDQPRDVAAATILCAALFELSQYSDTNGLQFMDVAINQIKSFASDDYTAALDSNNHFILMHGTGHYPAGREIDVPLNYADYYYLEALTRYRRYLNSPPKADFVYLQSDSVERLQLDFDASGSTDTEHDSLTYLWDFGDGHQELALLDTLSHVYASPGTYTVTLVASDKWGGSDTTSQNVLVSPLVRVQGLPDHPICIYPNPAIDQITIEWPAGQDRTDAFLVNAIGQAYPIRLYPGINSISTGHWENGCYFLVVPGYQESFPQKILIISQ